MSRWNEHGSITGPNWLVDGLGRILGYRDRQGNDYQLSAQTLPAGAESVIPGALLSPGGAGTLFTTIANGIVPASGGGAVAFLRADGSWAVPPVSTALFTFSTNGIAPASGGGTSNYLRADGTWTTPPFGPTYSQFSVSAAGIVPITPGGTTAFLRADGSWAAPPGSNYSVFGTATAGLVPASGGGTGSFLRADGSFATPPGTIYTIFSAVASGLVGKSGGGTSTFLRADGAWTTPAGAGDMSLGAVQLVTANKTFVDAAFSLAGATSGVTTIKASAIAGATTWTLPAFNDTFIGANAFQSLANKTLITPVISSIFNGAATLVLPSAANDTLMGRATVDTVSNKIFDSTVTAATQAPGDNSTKLATTAYADTKATAGVFTSVAVGQVPASGGGTSTFLRADGTFSTPLAATDVASVIASAITIPLDREGQGKYMPAKLLSAPAVLLIGGSPIENGSCVFCLVGNGTSSNVPDTSAFKLMNAYVFNYVAKAANIYSAVYQYGTAMLYGAQGNDVDLIPPYLVSAVVPNGAATSMILTWSRAVSSTVSAPGAFVITGGSHTVTADTYTTATTTTLTFSTAYLQADAATQLAYTLPGANPMKDTAPSQNLALSFSGFAITNNVISTPVFTAQSAPAGIIGTAYSYTFVATSATSYSVLSGAIPAGLSFNTATGVLSGTPTTAATSTFVISATNASGTTNSTSQSVAVSSGVAYLRFASLGANMAESGSAGAGWVYSGANGTADGSTINAGNASVSAPTTGDWSVTFTLPLDAASYGSPNLVYIKDIAANSLFYAGTFTEGFGVIWAGNPGVVNYAVWDQRLDDHNVGATILVAVGDIVRLARVGNDYVSSVARSGAPTSFTVLKAWPGRAISSRMYPGINGNNVLGKVAGPITFVNLS